MSRRALPAGTFSGYLVVIVKFLGAVVFYQHLPVNITV